MKLGRPIVLGCACVLGLGALVTLARVSIFFIQFDASWPAMFCYGPEGAFMFEAIAGIPLLAASVACALAVAQSRTDPFSMVPVAFGASAVSAFLLVRAWQLLQALTGHQYDEGCGRLAAWVWRYPLLNLVTRPISGAVLFLAVTIATVAVIYRAARAPVA